MGNTRTLLPYRDAWFHSSLFPSLLFDRHRVISPPFLKYKLGIIPKPPVPLLLLFYASLRLSPSPQQDRKGAALPKILHCGGNNGRQARPVSPPSLIWRVRPPTRRYCNFHSVAVVAVVAARGWRRWMWRFGRRLMGLMEGFGGCGWGRGGAMVSESCHSLVCRKKNNK